MPLKPLDTRKKIDNFIQKVPFLIDGSKKPRTVAERYLVNAFWAEIIQSIFDSAYEQYKVKSTGSADDLGIAWDDLHERTKAYYKKSVRKSLTKNQKAKQRAGGRGLLTAAQNKKWRQVYSISIKTQTKNDKESATPEIKRIAAGKAWNYVTSAGAETYKEVLGNAKVPIGIEDSVLLDSLKPGEISGSKYHRSNKYQIVKRGVGSGELELGTSVSYANEFAMRREFLPKDFGAWFEKAVLRAKDKLEEILEEVIS